MGSEASIIVGGGTRKSIDHLNNSIAFNIDQFKVNNFQTEG
jgi:hypothetical protein